MKEPVKKERKKEREKKEREKVCLFRNRSKKGKKPSIKGLTYLSSANLLGLVKALEINKIKSREKDSLFPLDKKIKKT